MQGRHREIIAAFTLLQLLVLVVFGYTPFPDSDGYIRLAADSVRFGEPYPVAHKISELAFIWNPGAINFTALSLALFGSVTPLLVFYCLLKGATAWLIHDIAVKLFGRIPALTALIMYVIYPANYGESTSLLSEIPTLFFSVLGLWLVVCRKKSIPGGAAIAFGSWFRPMGIVYLLALFLYKRKYTLKTIAGYTAMVCVIGGACYLRTGHFIYQAKTGWMALLQYSVDHTTDTDDDTLPFIQKANAVERDAIWRERFIAWLAEHPREYIAQIPAKLVNTYISDNVNLCAFLPHKQQRTYLYNELSMRTLAEDFPHYTPAQILTLVNLCYYYGLLLAFIAGCVILGRRKTWQPLLIPFTVIVASTGMLMLVGHGEARFHNTLMPFFIMVGAVTVTSSYRRKKEKTTQND